MTLIEVMLALTILGLGLSVLITTASKCLAVVRQAKNYETARRLLGQLEVEHPLPLEEEIQEGSEEGAFESGAPEGYRWERVIERIGREEDGLYSVRMRVTWSDRGKSAGEEVTTFLYRPEETKGGTVVSKPPR